MTEAEPKPPNYRCASGLQNAEREEQPDEFAHIPSRGARPPIVALLAVALAVFLAVRLRHDVALRVLVQTPRRKSARPERWPASRWMPCP